MARLWIIGDSFCDSSHSSQPWGWWDLVARRLGLELELRAHSGCAAQWQLRQWLEIRPQLAASDVVIFLHTHGDRIWFYEHLPWMTSPHTLDRRSLPRWSGRYKLEEVIRAEAEGLVPQVRADWCERHWETDRWSKITRDLQQIISLDVISQPVQRALVIWAFPDSDRVWSQPGIVGSLWEISQREFRDDVNSTESMMTRGDPRSGHLSAVNHHRLADRVCAFILGQSLNLDLTQGFAEHFLRSEDVWPPDK